MRINPENKSVDMEQRDINFIMPPYVRNYQFHNKNELPDKIIFPMFSSVTAGGKVIPIEYIAPDSEVAVEIAKDGADVAEVTPAQEAVLDEKDEEIKRLKAEVESLSQTERGGEDEGGTTSTTTITSEQLLDEAADLKLEEDTEPEVAGLAPEEEDYEAAKADQPEPETDTSATTPAPEDLIRQQQETDEEPKTLADEMPDEEPEVSPAKQAFADAESVQRIPKQAPGGDIGPGLPLSDSQPRDAGDQIMTAKALVPEPDIKEEEEKPFEKEIKRDEKGNPVVEDKPDE